MSPGRPRGACVSESGLPTCGPPSAPLSHEAVKQSTPARKFQKDLLSQWLLSKRQLWGRGKASEEAARGSRIVSSLQGRGRWGGRTELAAGLQEPQGYTGPGGRDGGSQRRGGIWETQDMAKAGSEGLGVGGLRDSCVRRRASGHPGTRWHLHLRLPGARGHGAGDDHE